MTRNHGAVYKAIDGKSANRRPIWLMRQAGRYLPEYNKIRKESGSFIDFCFDTERVVEATLQPIRRFNFDAAIIFSDILILPYLLGQKVEFMPSIGPVLGSLIDSDNNLSINSQIEIETYRPVLDAIHIAKSRLPDNTSLIGFCGAPWTVASYMIAGKSSPDQLAARIFAYKQRHVFQELIEILVSNSIIILDEQIKAGADIVQIFDTWANVLPFEEFKNWCIDPVARITIELKKRHPDVKIVIFAKGAGWFMLDKSHFDNIDAFSLDTSVSISWARKKIPEHIAIQGNLDPLALLAGGKALDKSIDEILEATNGRKHIFNLGHGILPTTPIEHVMQLVEKIRS